MDILLGKVTQQAMNYAIRSGITITSGYAIKQCSRLLKTVKGNERDEIRTLQMRLESKIRIISPAIDMIELIAARGNTSLESAVTLTKNLRWDIQSLGIRLSRAANEEELLRRGSSKAKSRVLAEQELKAIIADIKRLLERIEDAVPLINLAITTSGVNLSTTLPHTVSPSRLLQASTFLTAGDARYAAAPGQSVQVGPAFTVSMYMLFSGHSNRPHEEGIRETTWKEVMHKARVKLMRVPLDNLRNLPSPETQLSFSTNGTSADREVHFPADVPSEGKAFEFAYQLVMIEDLDDGRVHTFDDEDEQHRGPFEEVADAGIREVMPIHEVSKIFYADTGKILNIGTEGEVNNPILLLKRDANAVPPRRMMKEDLNEPQWYDEPPPTSPLASRDGADSDQAYPSPKPVESTVTRTDPWKLPPNLDPEWIAFEVFVPEIDSDDEDESDPAVSSPPAQASRSQSMDPSVASELANFHIDNSPPPGSPSPNPGWKKVLDPQSMNVPLPPTTLPHLTSSLSLLEILIRLTALQQFQQQSHLSITDELLNFFLSEAGTHGAAGDASARQRVRQEARMHIGFDPYDESPIKMRGEEYQRQAGAGFEEDLGWEEGSRAGTPRSARGSVGLGVREYSHGSAMAPRSPSPYVRPSIENVSPSEAEREEMRSPMWDVASPSPLLRKSFKAKTTTTNVSVEAVMRARDVRRKEEAGLQDSGVGTSPAET
ncbi:Ran-binding-domain-containing protein [Aulographum hederae CBS 113979]|uniref:Ran-binding-domain-containing protein n=1 Tax=Aulographum hederae CBS 113979 TaxID=1176131 RepID=A0A6G1GL94_9PEZI|nr:Ran-binding-domain-containing protein [Aulographum hederae CBS 113979]